MGKNKRRSQQKSAWIPPVGNGGIQKKQHANRPAPSIIVPGYRAPDNCQVAGYPILPFAVRVEPGPSTASSAPAFPPPSKSYGHPPPPLLPPPSAAPSIVILPPTAVNTARSGFKSPRVVRKKNAPVTVAVQSAAKAVNETITKKAQLKYAIQLAARANKRKSVSVQKEIKPDPEEVGGFNLFKNIAQRYRAVQKSPEAINIPDDSQDEDEVEDVEQNGATAAPNVTIFGDMSICTVDEVGEETMVAVEGEEERVEEACREIPIDDEEEDEEIVCLGVQKCKHVVVVLGDDDYSSVEVEEIDMSSDSTMMNRGFSEMNKSPRRPMVESIIDLCLDDDNGKVTSGGNLPDFIPLIDGEKKKEKRRRTRSKGGYNQSPSVQPVQQVGAVVQQQSHGGTQPQNGSSFAWPSAPIVGMTRSKSAKERKRDNYRKKAETRAMEVGASPSTVARALAASTCSFPQAPTPTKIPLPLAAAPPTPLARLYSCPPGSASAMGLIQSRGFSTSAPQSQPRNFGDYGMVHAPSSALVTGVAGAASSPTTLAAVLHDETVGVVRDALTANGIYRRQWEENWRMSAGSTPETKVDPAAAPFRICTYNVLCQKTITATEYLYRHTRFQPHVLEWSHRWPLIQKELSELNADVFGLQEIQDVHFEEYYEPFMKSLGYVCLFQRKSETAHSDGLGVFVRANRFKVSAIKNVDFLVPGDNLMNRGNVAQLVRVECLQTGASLIITNTHILFNEKRGDIKLGQIAMLMANIHAMRQEDEPVVCLGDWNLEPASDLYNYITSGRLDANQFVPRYGSGQLREGRSFNQAPMREIPMDTHLKTKMSRDGVLYQNEGALLQSLQRTPPSMFSHQIPLTSTYAPYQERRVSTFHKDIANPDFIFYTTSGRGEAESRRLRLIRRLAVPPEANIRQSLEPWPNHHVPSDHIPLMAEFYLSK